jgi:hypothetical protein
MIEINLIVTSMPFLAKKKIKKRRLKLNEEVIQEGDLMIAIKKAPDGESYFLLISTDQTTSIFDVGDKDQLRSLGDIFLNCRNSIIDLTRELH